MTPTAKRGRTKVYWQSALVGIVTALAFMGVTLFIWYSATLRNETALYLSIIFSAVLSILLGILSGVVRFSNTNLEMLVEERTRDLQIQTEKAKESARLKDQFVTTMSHELKTPLNAIIGFADILSEELQGPLNAKQKDSLKRLSGSAQDLHTLVSNILDLSKMEAGQMGLAISTYKPNEVLEEIYQMVPALLKEKDVRVELEKDQSLHEAEGDVVKIEQILTNLLTNAIKFTKKGQIRIASKKSQDRIVFTVEDTGIGIPREIIPYIFDAFRQADGSIRREYGGTGLGLHIVKSFVDSMKGDLKFESEAGKGTKVTVTLPLQVKS
jgi:signal transduction histidine kinase